MLLTLRMVLLICFVHSVEFSTVVFMDEVQFFDAERRGRHSHAERGNEKIN